MMNNRLRNDSCTWIELISIGAGATERCRLDRIFLAYTSQYDMSGEYMQAAGSFGTCKLMLYRFKGELFLKPNVRFIDTIVSALVF